MTTIISLAARDFIVVGCDSLATTSTGLIEPSKLLSHYFETSGELKLGSDGSPVLKNSSQVWAYAESRPINQLPSVQKLYDLEPIRACLLFAGASRIGEITIRNLVETFKAQQAIRQRKSNFTLAWLSEQIKVFILSKYEAEIPNPWMRPSMEIILSGYSARHREPEIWRINFDFDSFTNTFNATARNQIPRKQFNVVFGGQYDVIQRIVNGIDAYSWRSLRGRSKTMMDSYHDELMTKINAINPDIAIPKPNFNDDKYSIFGDDQGGVSCLYPDIGSLSQQAGIDFVYFLIDVMAKSQEFSPAIPTVGGKIHVALLTKSAPFQWISRETFKFENEHIPIKTDAGK